MDLGLRGRVALVTGGSRGIGAAIARELAAEGCRVAICARSAETLDATAAAIGATGAEVLPLVADLTAPDEAGRVVAATIAHFGALDLLETDLREARLRLRDDVRLHQVARRTDDGWYADTQLLQQEAGLRWSGGVDAYGATLLAGCDGRRRLGDLLAVLASSAGLAEGEAAEQVLPVVEQLVRQGFLTG